MTENKWVARIITPINGAMSPYLQLVWYTVYILHPPVPLVCFYEGSVGFKKSAAGWEGLRGVLGGAIFGLFGGR